MDAEEKNNLGIGEPSPDLPRFDPEDHAAFPVVVVIPGRAFDRKCNRVGRGMGYYDRFLRDLLDRASGPVFLVGVCFCFQIVPSIQTGTSDVPMDIVIAENARIG